MDARLLLTEDAARDRYDGRPFLRLLECYVLSAIGELSDDHEATLTEITPKLQATYELVEPWPRIVEHAMELSSGVPRALLQLWQQNLAISAASGEAIEPEAWARQVVDKNFV